MLYSLASSAAKSSREVWWLHAAHNAKEHVFAQEARQLLNNIAGSHSFIAYSKPDPADRLGENFDMEGHLDLGSLQRLNIPTDADFYMCGPTGFQRDMTQSLISLHVPRDSIYQEVFGPASSLEPGVVKRDFKTPHPPVHILGNGPIVSFTRSNLSVPWDSRFKSLLEFAEACDVPVRWACRSGVCHTCECGILSGKLHYSPEPLDQPAAGNALICCSTPESQIDLDL
jgi:ferredoxin